MNQYIVEKQSWSARHPVLKKNLIILSLVLVAEVALLSFNARLDTITWRATRWFMGDQQPYNWNRVHLNPATHPHAPWWRTVTPPLHSQIYHKTENFWRILRDVGEPEEVIFVAAVLLWYDPARWKAAAMLVAGVLGAGGVSAIIKPLAGRLRPIAMLATHHHNNGVSIWVPMRNFIDQKDLSFPSGHATAAFAMAAVMIYLSPRGRILFLVVAWATAFSRMVMQAHFYSDIIAGSTIGWFVGFAIAIWLGQRLGVPQRHLTPGAETAFAQ